MPLSEGDLNNVRARLLRLFLDIINTVELIDKRCDELYGNSSPFIRAAIAEYLNDFIRQPTRSGEIHPEAAIYAADRTALQHAGLYGAQLAAKELQLNASTAELETVLKRPRGGLRRFFRAPFAKWVDRVNNFIGSLVSAAGVGEALKELKDLLRGELPEDDD